MRLITFLLSLLSIITFAQDGINYQGVATNGSGAELINQNISVKASVISDSSNGTIQWQEIHSTTTDQFGLFNVVIGKGSSTGVGQTNNFDNMNWGSGNHYLRIEMDATGGSNYTLISASQMMSVPYALYAKNSAIDSMSILNLINSSTGSNLCDYAFPEGLNGYGINEKITSGNSYTVPNNKRLYITNMFNAGLGITINGTHTNYSASFSLPIVANAGDIITQYSSNNPLEFNGYLANEDYFANCGGGGSSSSSSLDSLTIVSMINNITNNNQSIGIGDYFQGGVVGYIFKPGDAGYVFGETHGYILYCDHTGIQWGCNGMITNVTDNNIGQGPNNTNILDSLCPEPNFAARWCNDLVVGGYDDWFLPTYQEAILIDISVYLNLLNSSSYVQIWLSEEYTTYPNLYNHSCPSCFPNSHAWALVNVGSSLEPGPRLKINSQSKNIIAFRKF